MLYKKNEAVQLDKNLFQNPTSEYRGTPFWAWNCKLEQEELNWQLDVLKEMGFGGAHMHVRTGLETPYLSEEHMEFVKNTVNKAKNEGMLAWLYDEDRWPSGAAGGLVTKEEKYRARYLLFTPFPYGSVSFDENDYGNGAHARAVRAENGVLLSCYDVHLDSNGTLIDWKVISKDEQAKYDKWYAYLETHAPRPWYNNQAYVDTLNKEAIDRFIEITYEKYNQHISEEFNNTVPAIFTDEPQFTHKSVLKYGTEKADVTIPWTDDLAETYTLAYGGENILENLPELFWDYADNRVSKVRYHYHDHVCERFVNAFADNCNAWCEKHNLLLTGHMMEEPTLESQTAALGEAMRSYRSFTLPGIDMLCNLYEYTTAKQTQSASHQYGREGVLSELYGVTNWDYDARGHKLQGDWQAALGVTVRVPHLSWVSMAGEAKRDYPASINYQSPWWKKYSYIEDHYARLNTAMTRGKASVRVGVIHPIESYWLHWGPAEQTAMLRDSMDRNFQNITEWLLFGGIDFDYISESLLPELCDKGTAPLRVGAMEYDAIIVPGCETLRSYTLECLEGFQMLGGKLIFAGQIPSLENASPSERGSKLAEKSQCIAFEQNELLSALADVREIEIRDQSGKMTSNLLYQMREDTTGKWLFIAHGKEPYNKDVSTYQDLRIRVKGQYKVSIYHTITGEIVDACQKNTNDYTEITYRMYDYDSLLLWLERYDDFTVNKMISEGNTKDTELLQELYIPDTVSYSLDEPNVLLLDQAEYALDNEPWQVKEEILRLDDICREKLGLPSRKIPIAQPWAVEKETPTHFVRLRWKIQSSVEMDHVQLAIEDAECAEILWNGKEVANTITGWYVDKSIKTVELGTLEKDNNILEVKVPFGRNTNLEWAYLLGDFGVEVFGRHARIIEKRTTLAFGDITRQGLPFYGGNITYHIPVETKGGGLAIRSNRYRGFIQCVSIDEKVETAITYPPYTLKTSVLESGKHTVNLTLYGHRRNSFGPIHLADLKEPWIGPEAWRSDGEKWCYDYLLCEEGILASPVIFETIER